MRVARYSIQITKELRDALREKAYAEGLSMPKYLEKLVLGEVVSNKSGRPLKHIDKKVDV